MGFYDKRENVEGYIAMCEPYESSRLVDTVKKLLPIGSHLLEIGMGPGYDLTLLRKRFECLGTDYAQDFLDIYQAQYPEASLALMDAVGLETKRTFDGIFSNKVLIHLTLDELKASLKRQDELLAKGGYVFHSFWRGEGESDEGGILHKYYDDETLKAIFSEFFDVLLVEGYREFDDHDSVFVVAKKKG